VKLQIRETIAELENGAKAAVQAMDSSGSKAKDVVTRTRSTGQALQEIISAVERVDEMNTQIANSAEEQLCMTEEISRNIAKIADKADKTADRVEHTWLASGQLRELSGSLAERVRHFKI
jgi:methyl-accepting chemotaxis protein